ncbi:MAG TPA: tetratricopeptide repeat protein [Pirellulaceae bacterium]|nr:tetratricopeptide repeat protein [Pirellulaceae bacterium]
MNHSVVTLSEQFAEVERMVQQWTGHLEVPPSAVVRESSPTVDLPTDRLGSKIGPYKLLQKIGEGGFGVVLMAEQVEPVRRRVALKVIKLGMDTRQVIARFEAEKQALALMDHVNIARVLDAGTTEQGRPYFVMELVHGVPITKYCDDNRLTPRERLELFVPVCQAIQHAHQKGIIHRDIKPSNVMVTLYDGKPVPKVIDFGVAKATAQRLTERTLCTQCGTMVGTPRYMSPEQAEMSGLDIDTRSDIYSLGVLLYELLTGSTPLSHKRLKEAAYGEVLRMIREEEAPKPSTRLSDSGEALASISANRHTEAAKLTKLVRGELDWIVMKCLEKDRNRRYETANGFVRDLQRYLADEPVQACPPSAAYRLRKFARRNRGPVLGAALVLLALVGGIIGTTWGMIQAEQASRKAHSAKLAQAERAEGERRAKEEVQKRLAQIEKGTEILASVFRDLDPLAEEKEGVTLRVLLGRRLGEAAQELEGEAVGDPLVVARLQHVLGVSLRELGHLEQAEVVLVKAWQTRERLLGADHLDTVATKHQLAMLYRDQGKYAPAEALHKEVLAVRTAKLGADHPDTLTTQHHLAIVYGNQGKHALAETLFKEVLAVRTARLGPDHPDTLHSQHRLALEYRLQKKYALAETLYKEGLAVRTASLGADHLDTVATKQNLAALYVRQGKYAMAEPLHREVLAVRTAKLGADHPDTLTSQHRLADLYYHQGKYVLAEALSKEVLAVRTAKLGADHPDTLDSQHSLAMLYRDQEKYAPAEALFKEMVAIRTAKLGADHPDTLGSQHNLAKVYWYTGRVDRSILLLEETLKRRKAILGPDHPDTLDMQADLGAMYCDTESFADAIPLLEEVHRKGRMDPELAWIGSALLAAYALTGKTTEATALAAEQVQAARQQFPADSPQLATALADTAKALLDAKVYADAESLLREILSFREKTAATFWATHHTQSLLGAALLGQEKYAAAEPPLLQGYAGLREREAAIPSEVKSYPIQALERLVQLYDAWDKPDEAAKWRKELEKSRE